MVASFVEMARARGPRVATASILIVLAAARAARGQTLDDEPRSDEPKTRLSQAHSLPSIRGGVELRAMYPYGFGVGAAVSAFIAESVWVDLRYDYIPLTMGDMSTRSRSGHYASGFIGIPLLHEFGRTQTALYLDEQVVFGGLRVYYTNAPAVTHHYLLLDAGVVTTPLSYGLCPNRCPSDTGTRTQIDIQAVIPGAGVRYIYLYKVDSPERTRAARGWVELGARGFYRALNSPIGDVYFGGAKVNPDRPGFIVDFSFEMFSFWPGLWLVGVGTTPAHSPLYFELGYAFLWF